MSDRDLVIEIDMLTMESAPRRHQKIQLFSDGESGTWRLFLGNDENPFGGCVDFSLTRLKEFYAELGRVIQEIDADPDKNAEIRATWVNEYAP